MPASLLALVSRNRRRYGGYLVHLGVIVLANHRYAPATLLARELMTALIGSEAVAPRRIQPAPAMSTARAGVERLIEAWDDDLAGRLFAMNMEDEEPLDRMRRLAVLEKLAPLIDKPFPSRAAFREAVSQRLTKREQETLLDTILANAR